MARWTTIASLSVVIMILAGTVTGTSIALNHIPTFYKELTQTTVPKQDTLAQEFVTEFGELINAVTGGDKEWFARFHQNQINAYLSEGLVQLGLDNSDWNEKLKGMRFAMQGDKLSVGFRHRIGPFDPVIHMEAQLWLAQGEANTIAIRILSAKAGAIPIHPQAILERISESATQNGMDVSWFRHNGCPVAILRFQADRPRPTFLLRSLAIDKGLLVIRGSSVDDDNPAQPSPTP
ncbi:MAG: hypothetical protein EXS11_08615 [Gemmataceae bacterium]|nr:hypothetical protein [Gemmataceae bacterium]